MGATLRGQGWCGRRRRGGGRRDADRLTRLSHDELFDRAVRLIARFDLADRSGRLAVEVDGKRGHAGAATVAADRRRDRRSEALGWHTERVSWYELRREPAAFVRRVRHRHALLAGRQTST